MAASPSARDPVFSIRCGRHSCGGCLTRMGQLEHLPAVSLLTWRTATPLYARSLCPEPHQLVKIRVRQAFRYCVAKTNDYALSPPFSGSLAGRAGQFVERLRQHAAPKVGQNTVGLGTTFNLAARAHAARQLSRPAPLCSDRFARGPGPHEARSARSAGAAAHAGRALGGGSDVAPSGGRSLGTRPPARGLTRWRAGRRRTSGQRCRSP